MRSADAHSPTPIARAAAEKRELRLRRLLAFTGVAPLGAFVVVHLITTATAVRGPARFDRIFASPSSVFTALTVAFVILPLAFHAAYGTYLALSRRAPLASPRWLPRVRRAAALGTALFLAYHLWPRDLSWASSMPEGALYDSLTCELSSTFYGFPLRAVLYMLGVAATAFHLASSLWTFCTTWGVVVTPSARRAAAWALGALGALLFLVGANTVVFFATGTRLAGSPSAPSRTGVVPHGPCPQPDSQ